MTTAVLATNQATRNVPYLHFFTMKLDAIFCLLALATCLSDVASHGDEPSPKASQSAVQQRMPRPREGRNLIIGNILCENEIANICICSLEKFLEAFENASTDEDRPTKIQLCYGSYFPLEAPINITGKSFTLKCIRPEQCVIEGVRSNVFVGAPKNARFVFLSVEFGEGAIGGAMHLTGGKARFTNLYMYGHEASVTGGAIHLEGPDTVLTTTGTIFKNNNVTGNGGAISLANGATFRSIRSSYLGNAATGSGGGIYNNGGTVKLTFSLFKNNVAPIANDLVITSTSNASGVASNVECASLLKTTFCDGFGGVVQSGIGTTNCFDAGMTRDLRCTILDVFEDDDFIV